MHECADRLAGSILSADRDIDREFEERLVDSSTLAFRVAFAVLRHQQDAEDVAQEALVKAHRCLRHLRDRTRFRAWLVRMSWRLAIDRQRADRRRRARTIAPAEHSEQCSGVDEAEAHDRASRLWQAIDTLPEKLRVTIVYALTDDTIAQEIERALQVCPGPAFLAAVRSRIAEEPAGAFRMHRMGWGVVALACALLAVFAAPLQRVERTPSTVRGIAPVPSRTYVSNTTASLRDASMAHSPVRVAITNQPEEFDVLVAPDEAAALRRLLNGAPLHVAVAMETTPPEPSSPAATRDIVIPFIAIDLLESTKASEGGTP